MQGRPEVLKIRLGKGDRRVDRNRSAASPPHTDQACGARDVKKERLLQAGGSAARRYPTAEEQ